ncbi:hypothetical protein [Aestuariimicrobium ganziense]|uniref:hypothetical protein n=1 Tax=Aestuariimicrobium ganziense TaxID=2773677 RepID=UPI0019426B2F|nr:hypothetical protein [Aestuariimicrobium ganziense]
MIVLEIGAGLLSFLTFVVLFTLVFIGYLSLRRHVRRIELPLTEDDAAAPVTADEEPAKRSD